MRKKLPPIYLVMITVLLYGAVNAGELRFVPLNHTGKPVPEAERNPLREWPCILDQNTGLIWEGKTRSSGLHHLNNTFNWFDTDPTRNGGLAGEPTGQECRKDGQLAPCDTQSFIDAVNAERLCNTNDWRLPHREELRSLVNYSILYPGPTIDTRAFPNAVAQFYWSADPNASEPREAWGIGFAFGFDYAYFKNNRVRARLVSDGGRTK